MGGLATIGFRNFILNGKRNLFPVLLIGVSTFVICSFLGYVEDVTSLFRDTYVHRSMYGHAIIESNASMEGAGESLMSVEDWTSVREVLDAHVDDISAVVRTRRFAGQIETSSRNAYFLGLAYDLDAGRKMRTEQFEWDTIVGSPLTDPSAAKIVMGRKLAPHLGCEPESELRHLNGALGFPAADRPFVCAEREMRVTVTTDRGSINASEFQVSGFLSTGFEEFDSHIIQMSLEQAQEILDSRELSSVNVLFAPGADHDSVLQSIRDGLSKTGRNIRITYWSDHKWSDLFVRTVEWLAIFRTFVVAVVIVVASLSLSTTTMRSLVKRLPEVGTLRTMGYKGPVLMTIFLSEALLVALTGSLLGILLSALVSLLLTDSLMAYQAGFLSDPVPFRIAFSWQASALASAFMSAVTLLTCLLTVRRASRMPIVACFMSAQT